MNWHYTTIQYAQLTTLGLSLIEYVVSDITYHRSKAGEQWWAYSPQEIADLLGINESTVREAVKRCVEKETIKKDGKLIISCQKYIDMVYPSTVGNTRSNVGNTREATGETPAYYNYIGKKELPASQSDSGVRIVLEGEERPKKDTSLTKEYDSLISWLDGLTGVRTFQRAKAYTALASARTAEISKTRLKNRAEELFADSFYQEKGLNWAMVVSSFNRKA